MIFGLLVQTMMVASIGPPPELPMGDYHPPIKNSSDCHFAYSYKTDTKGMFASPGFPSEYPDSVTCSYFFHASASGRVQITFDFFSLEKPSDKGCTFDYLEIYYVNNNGFKDLIDRFCGTNTPKDFISHHPKMEILFVSDFTKHSNGFLAHYTFLGDKYSTADWHYFGPSTMGCGPEFLLGSGGIIQSPGYPSLARPRSSCTWIIIVEDTEKVLLTLVDLSSSNNQGTEEHLCGRSRLAFYNGFAVPGMLPERAYCGPMAEVYYGKREYWSSSSRVVVRFETDIDGPMLSFKLSWTAVELVENVDSMAESQDDQMQSAVTCDTCEETAEHLCKTCHDRLCSRCKMVHNRSKASFDHEVVLLSFSAISLANEESIPFQQVCSKHGGSRISICCSDCEMPICEKCLLPEHSGHRVISISDLIKQKEPKIKAKYSVISSQLSQYEDKLEEIKKRRSMVEENSNVLEEKIEKHYLKVQSKIENQKTKLLKDVHEDKTVTSNNLQVHENMFEEYIKKMKTFMTEFETELSQEKTRFILFGNSNVEATIPNNLPKIRFPELLQYETETHDEASLHSLCGRLYEGKILHRNYTTKEFRVINVGNSDITSLAYRCQDDTFWLYTYGKILQIDREGNILFEKEVTNANTYNNKPVVVSHTGAVIYRQNQLTLNKRDFFGFEKEFFTTSYSATFCLWARKEGGVIVGYLDKGESDGRFFWLTEDAVIEKEIGNNYAWNYVYNQYFFSRTRAYVAENVNGDICFSNRSVEVYDSNLQHRFSYPNATDVESFLPQDICTDDFGQILIADQRSRLIHILNKDGILLKMVKLPGLSTSYPISLTIDVNRCLCVGCSDGKIRFIDYLTILDNL